MPRLDETNPRTIRRFNDVALVPIEMYVEADRPVDLCLGCWGRGSFYDDVEHPPYEWQAYECALCGDTLTEEDN